MKRYRLTKDDTVYASLVSDSGRLLSCVYDSGFSSREQVFDRLCRMAHIWRGHMCRFSMHTNDGDKVFRSERRRIR